MDLTASLQNLGLTEKEAKVYLALLQTGKSTAYSLALRSNLKKPTVYVILENLIIKGVVQKIPRTKKALYTAISPEELFDIAKNKMENAKNALPELQALSRGKEYKVRASYYEGLPAIREMYNRLIKLMKGKEYVGFFAHAADAPTELIKYFDELNENHGKNHIKRRGITVNDPKSMGKYLEDETARRNNIKLKALPMEFYNSNISIEIYDNYTQIFSHRHMQATVIDNPDVANVMRQIFELIWERKDLNALEIPKE